MKHYFSLLVIFILMSVTSRSQVAISADGTGPDPSSAFEVSSTSGGMLIPRMTTAQRNAIIDPAPGLQLFNSTTSCLEIFIPPVWQNIYCGCNPPAAPSMGVHEPSADAISWNWQSQPGVDGYKYSTSPSYASATDVGTSNSYIQSGLNCATSYTLYVWAYSDCGPSQNPLMLVQSTSACFACGQSVTFTYKGSTVTYGTVSGQYGTCWLDRNLGAAEVATAINHSQSYGDLFQWGRGDDGHQARTPLSPTTTTLSLDDNPGHGDFIIATSPNDWRSPSNSGLWQGVDGVNNPCPLGWRIPTMAEWESERLSWATSNSAGAIASSLKLPAGGMRYFNGTTMYYVGSEGRYWSSTPHSSTSTKDLRFTSSSSQTSGSYYRATGFSVRCLKD